MLLRLLLITVLSLGFLRASDPVSESVASILRLYDQINRIKRDFELARHTFASDVTMTEASAANVLAFNKILEKDGWLYFEGFVGKACNGSSIFVRCFRSFESMLYEVERSDIKESLADIAVVGRSNKKAKYKTLYIVVNYLINQKDKERLITWLNQSIQNGIDNYPGSLMDCKARMIIEHYCCTKLSKKIGYRTIRVRVG